jgi:hypothetical protein
MERKVATGLKLLCPILDGLLLVSRKKWECVATQHGNRPLQSARHLLVGCLHHIQSPPVGHTMFGYYSNRLGCLGSLLISVIGSVLLILLMRSCNS